jgi:hypothetical protein
MRRRLLPFIAVSAVAASALTGCTAASPADSCNPELNAGALSQSVRLSGDSPDSLSVTFSAVTSPANAQRSVVQQTDAEANASDPIVDSGMIVEANFAFVDVASGEVLQVSDTYGTNQGGLSIAAPEAGPIFNALHCATVGETTATVLSEEDSMAMGASGQLLLITEILDATPTRAVGTSRALPTGFPAVTVDETGRPGIVLPPQQAPSSTKSALRIEGTGELVTAEQNVVGQVLTVSWDGQQLKNSWESLPEGFGNEETSAQSGATFRTALTGYPVGSQVVVIEPGEGEPRVSVIDILAVL